MHTSDKIYVAGHQGLVGSAILKVLLKAGYTNVITKTHSELELTNQQAVATFFAKEKPKYVFLAAAKVGGIHANNLYRADFIYQNLMIQNNVIHQSYLFGVQKLLFLGSTCIYPKKAIIPIEEKALLTDVLEYTNEPYAIAKIAGIKMCESYNVQYQTNFLSIMPTNLYGIEDNFNLETSHVIPALIRKMYLAKLLATKQKEKIVKNLNLSSFEEAEQKLFSLGITAKSVEIWGSGKPKREFLWSEDLASACLYIMKHLDFTDIIPKNTKEIRNTHINIGTGEEISIKELAILIKGKIGFEGSLQFNTDKPDGTMQKGIDSTKLHQLGWKHTVTLEKGITKLCQWYTENK
jgi:GDP-L-fucose synthase